MCDSNCFDCKIELNLHRICARKGKFDCLLVNKFKVDKFCSEEVSAKQLYADKETVNDLCAQNIKSVNAGFINLNSNNLCSQNATINNLCATNLNVGSLNLVQKYRAAVSLAANTNYILGNNLNFDLIIDDPNSNVALAPFSYTAPVGGYYAFDFSLSTDSLVGASTILGVPTGVLELTVNGLNARSAQTSYLSFTALQKSNLGGILILQAGDIVRCNYSVLVVDPTLGLMPYVGTVNLIGLGAVVGGTKFEIHYLSSIQQSPIVCASCPLVEVPCAPIIIDCDRNGDSPDCLCHK